MSTTVRDDPRVSVATDDPCPTWCLEPHGHPYVVLGIGDPAERDHRGPSFGRFTVEAVENAARPGDLDYVVSFDVHDDGPAPGVAFDLRDLAAHAVAAAEWLEAQR